MPCYRLLVAILLQSLPFLLAGPALAQPAIPAARPTHIAASLAVEHAARPGQTVMLALHMQPEPGWHGYWSNPGDAGFGMTLKWRLPDGFSAGAPRYPVPQTLLISGLMNHVYERDYAVLVPLAVPPAARPGERLPVTVEANWLACTDKVCVPERAVISTELLVGAPGDMRAGVPSPPRLHPLFDQWTRRLPAPLGSPASFALTASTLRLAIPLPDSVTLDQPHVFVGEDKVVAYAAVQGFSRGNNLLIAELPRAKIGASAPASVTGILRLNRKGNDGLAFVAAPGTVPAPGMPLEVARESTAAGFALLLLGALAGGLLLNIMPCVFPILSLKALSLARSGGREAAARPEGLAYTAGVVAASLGLGALLLALRAGGGEVGWAFQLQEPLVVAALLMLAAALTANFLGLFEFAVPGFANAGSAKGAFSTGLLAAFVATPCTGPFMAAAMGAALLLPVAPAMALFAALGLGLALPFLAIAFIPALRRRLPKPGAWMNTFRRWMALPMGLTALALVWLASRLGGWNFALAAAALAAAMAALLWLAGRRQRRSVSAAPLVLGGIAALVLAGSLALPLAVTQPAAAAQGLLPARPFSETALAAARAQGMPVFVWFTADWCLTCKVNEQVAIERTEVRDAFARAGVVVLRGDWTRRDLAITRFLTAQGAAGVPLYLWYPPGGGAPRQLPQVLTPGMLTGLAQP